MLIVRALLVIGRQYSPLKEKDFQIGHIGSPAIFFFFSFGLVHYVIHLYVLCDHSVALI